MPATDDSDTVDDERLAAYAAGEADADERAEVENALARNPGLRRRLDALRQVDAALTGLEQVAPPPGYGQRLRRRVAGELDVVLGDELAARRRRRTPLWLPTAAAAAAALVGIIGVGTWAARSGLGAGGATTSPDVAETAAGAVDAAATAAADGSGMPGPVVVASGRELDEAALVALLEEARLQAVADRGVATADGAAVADAYARALGALPPTQRSPQQMAAPAPASTATGSAGQPESAGTPAATAAGGRDQPTAGAATGQSVLEEQAALSAYDLDPLRLVTEGELASSDVPDVVRCLGEVTAGAPVAVPAYAELAQLEGEPVIIYGLVTPDPKTGSLGRVEIWAVARTDCQVRAFVQS